MKVFSLLFILSIASGFAHASCGLNKNHSIYSLSGPVTMLMEELEVLDDKALKGISVFHPVKDYQGKKLGGGIFLSPRVFSKKANTLVFYDKSRQLKKSLSQIENVKSIEINTRKKDAYAATLYVLSQLSPYLVNCQHQLASLRKKIRELKLALIKKKLDKEMIFFIEKIKTPTKLPPMIMVNDGIVLTLKKYAGIKTYQSPLEYVSWSSFLMKNKYKDYIKVGLVSDVKEPFSIDKINKHIYNINYRGVLIPGIRQVYFLKDFLKKGVSKL